MLIELSHFLNKLQFALDINLRINSIKFSENNFRNLWISIDFFFLVSGESHIFNIPTFNFLYSTRSVVRF